MITTSDLEGPIRISVIIPHLNQPQMLARCLASLGDGTRAPDEIIVVDNGSQVMPDVPEHVTLLREDTPGPGPARNHGVAHATGNVLAFIDADCLAGHVWLEHAAKRIETAMILGGDVRIAYRNPAKLGMIEAYESIYGFRQKRYIAQDGYAATCNMVVRQDVLKVVGDFGGLHMAEDRDWGQRATAMGYKIHYVPLMQVYHPARRNFAELYAKWDRALAHDFTLIKTRGDKLRWWVKTAMMGISPLGEVPLVAGSRRVKGFDRIKAFAGLCRIRVYRAVRMIDLGWHGAPERLSGTWNR